jgi:cold shock CspA family protein
MTTPPAAAVHTIVRILAHRATPAGEVPDLIDAVSTALKKISEPNAAEPAMPAHGRAERRPRRSRQRRDTAMFRPVEEEESVAPAPAPTLLRRADIVAAPHEPAQVGTFLTPRHALRGIVKWFDARAGRGALRVPGYSHDVAVDAAQLAEAGIARLYKGQEVDAQLDRAGDAGHLVRLSLPGSGVQRFASAGIVRGRQAKPVVVELKRESLRRVAARADAALLLRPPRPR